MNGLRNDVGRNARMKPLTKRSRTRIAPSRRPLLQRRAQSLDRLAQGRREEPRLLVVGPGPGDEGDGSEDEQARGADDETAGESLLRLALRHDLVDVPEDRDGEDAANVVDAA